MPFLSEMGEPMSGVCSFIALLTRFLQLGSSRSDANRETLS